MQNTHRVFHIPFRMLVLGVLACASLSGEATASAKDKGDSRALRDFLKATAHASSASPAKWNTDLEYSHTITDPERLSRAHANEETAQAGFATLRRSFGAGEVRPFFGVGVGDAKTQFGRGTDAEIALKGVVGTDLHVDEKVTVFVQYGYAIESGGSAAGPAKARSHGINFGFSVQLH